MSLWWNRGCQGVLLYAALALQVSWDDAQGPQWVLVVLCWWLGQMTSRQMVQWAMLCGLSLDLAGHESLGLHLAVCGGLAACLSLTVSYSLVRGFITLPVITIWFAATHLLITESLARSLSIGESTSLAVLLESAARCGLMTGGVVLLLSVIQVMMRRLLWNSHAGQYRELQNQWLRLSEA